MSVSRSALASSAARSALRPRASSPPSMPADRARDRAHALHALALRAELVVVDDLVEPGHARLERASCGPGRRRTSRRPGAGAPRARCLRSTRLGSSGRMLLTMRNRFVSAPAGVEQREVLLVRLHRQDQAFGRHRQELALEAAQQHVRPLDQRGHLVEQRLVVDRRQALRAPPRLRAGARSRRGARRSRRSPRPARSSCARVVVGVLQHHRRRSCASKRWPWVCAAGRQAERASPAPRRRRAAPPGRAPGARSCTLVQPSASWYCITFGIGSLASASSSAFCRPSASVAPGTTLSRNSASALPSGWRLQRRGTADGVGAERRRASSAAPASAGRPRRARRATGISFCSTRLVGRAARARR